MPYKDPEKQRQYNREYQREWRKRNPEKTRAKQRKWRAKNLEYDRERCLKYRADNRDRLNEYQRDYSQEYRKTHPGMDREAYRKNPERFKLKTEKRRALKRGATRTEEIVPLVVLERDDGTCGICGGDVDPLNFHVDHIVPLSRGGSHTYDNVQAAHPSCNCSKRADLPEAA